MRLLIISTVFILLILSWALLRKDRGDYQSLAVFLFLACTAFATAEAALVKAADFVPWAERPNKIYINKVEYQYTGRTDVMSLRMLAE